MKYFYLVVVLIIEFLLIKTLKLLDNSELLLFLFGVILAAGVLLVTFNKGRSKTIQDIGSGMLFAGLFTIVAVIGFLIWLSFNFPS